jgi:hypothetical protein
MPLLARRGERRPLSWRVSAREHDRHRAAASAVLGHACRRGWASAIKPPIPKRHEPEKRICWAAPSCSRRKLHGFAAAKAASPNQQDAEIDQAPDRTHNVRIANAEEDEILLRILGVADGTRTHDNRNHNRKKGVVAFRKRLNKKKVG